MSSVSEVTVACSNPLSLSPDYIPSRLLSCLNRGHQACSPRCCPPHPICFLSSLTYGVHCHQVAILGAADPQTKETPREMTPGAKSKLITISGFQIMEY